MKLKSIVLVGLVALTQFAAATAANNAQEAKAEDAFNSGRYAEAGRLFQAAATEYAKSDGPESANVQRVLNRQAMSVLQVKDFEDAADLYERVYSMAAKHNRLTPEDVFLLDNLSGCYFRLSKFDRAATASGRAYDLYMKGKKRENMQEVYLLTRLTTALEQSGDWKTAESKRKRLLQLADVPMKTAKQFRSQKPPAGAPPDHFARTLPQEVLNLVQSLHGLANNYAKQGKYPAAEPYYVRATKICEEWHPGMLDAEYSRVLHDHAEALRKSGKAAEATKLDEKAKLIRAKH